MSNYSKKLKDPRWQKLRLNVFDRDKWACKLCNDDKSELHVHHTKYSGEPWDAPIDDLQTLCCDCHLVVSAFSKNNLHISEMYKSLHTMNGDILCCFKSIEGEVAILEKRDNGMLINVILFKKDSESLKEIINFLQNG